MQQMDRGAQTTTSPDRETSLPQSVLTVVGAIGTGVGVLGWVTFLGGSILWIKAAESGLPATEAVAVTPKTVLLTQGAEVAALAVMVAVGAVGILYVVDQFLQNHGAFRLSAAKAIEEVHEANVDAAREEEVSLQRQAAESQRIAEEARLRAGEGPDDSRKQALERAAQEQLRIAVEDERRASAAKEGFEAAERELTRCRQVTIQRGRNERWTRRGLLGLLLLGAPVAFALVNELSWTGVGGVLLIAALGSGLSALVLARERWVWFGVAAFLTVSIALTATTFIRTKEELKVEPAAVLREGAGPVCGFFVAQTSDHVYLGTYGRRVAVGSGAPAPPAGECTGTEPVDTGTLQRALPARLMSLPASEVTDTAIGPPLLLSDDGGDDAPGRSAAMALDLCERRLVSNGAKAQVREGKRTGCTAPEIERLRESAEQ
jgi:hypothetical protein